MSPPACTIGRCASANELDYGYTCRFAFSRIARYAVTWSEESGRIAVPRNRTRIISASHAMGRSCGSGDHEQCATIPCLVSSLDEVGNYRHKLTARLNEIKAMSGRLKSVRDKLYDLIVNKFKTPGNWIHIKRAHGMYW